MKNLNIPGTCVKCKHEMKIEKCAGHKGAAYCPACDFILRLTEDEMQQYLVLAHN